VEACVAPDCFCPDDISGVFVEIRLDPAGPRIGPLAPKTGFAQALPARSNK
jgi:hypothetical protein